MDKSLKVSSVERTSDTKSVKEVVSSKEKSNEVEPNNVSPEEIRIDKWLVRDRDDPSSSMFQNSTPSFESISDPEKETVVDDLNDAPNQSIIDKMEKLSIGRKRGIPRKHERKYNFSISKTKKSTGGIVKQKSKAVNKELSVQKSLLSAKDRRRKKRLEKIEELEGQSHTQQEDPFVGKELALQVLEAGETMGIIPLKDREMSPEMIIKHLQC